MDREGQKADTLMLVVGLGNPGEKYEATRHNFGAVLIEYVAEHQGVVLKKHRTNALSGKAELGGREVMLARPRSFMNESGGAVAALAKFFKIDTSHIVLIYDDIALPFGTLRIGINTSSGGHNGVQSVIDHLGAADFIRLRLGIAPQQGKAEEYVLKQWSSKQKKELPEILDRAASALAAIISDGPEKAANLYN